LEQDCARPLKDAAVRYRTVLVEADSVDDGLLKLAAKEDAALIVLGMSGHRDLKDRLLGGVIDKVLHESGRPVVVVPAGWSGTPGP
jgi:nucleotide-binding universal stress UspA family protein